MASKAPASRLLVSLQVVPVSKPVAVGVMIISLVRPLTRMRGILRMPLKKL